MKPGLADMKNAIVVPHIASASKVMIAVSINSVLYFAFTFSFRTRKFLGLQVLNNPTWYMQWTREGMATLAALNVLVCNLKKKNYRRIFSLHLGVLFCVQSVVVIDFNDPMYREKSKVTQPGLIQTMLNHS